MNIQHSLDISDFHITLVDPDCTFGSILLCSMSAKIVTKRLYLLLIELIITNSLFSKVISTTYIAL